MGSSYSVDLRKKVINKYNEGNLTQEELSSMFGISVSTIKRWLKLLRKKNTLNPQKIGSHGRPSKLNIKHLNAIKHIVKENPAITLLDLSALMYEKSKIKASNNVYTALLGFAVFSLIIAIATVCATSSTYYETMFKVVSP